MTPVRLERRDGLAVLVLDDPPLNLFGRALVEELAARVAELVADPPRALLIRAEGEITSGGADVNVFAENDGPGFAALSRRCLDEVVHPVEALPCPTIFAAHGLCLTAAFELALACDLLLARDDAQFGLVEAAIGTTPSMGGGPRLAAKAGPTRAAEALLTAKIYPAATMLEWGVVNRVYDKEGFATAVDKFASRVATGATRAHAATKRMLRAVRDGGVTGGDALLPELVEELFATEDLQRGIAGFLEHGMPGRVPFNGR